MKANLFLLVLVITSTSCFSQNSPNKERNNHSKPTASIEELEMEVNNGGFNQYFFNSGQNCFETLKVLKRNGKLKTAKILEDAISLINPKKLSNNVLIQKLQNKELLELDNEKISASLYQLDLEFYKYPDGNLTQ